MKPFNYFLLLLLYLISGIAPAQKPSAGKAKDYFIRSTGFTGWAFSFTTFIDDQLVCSLNNKRYSVHEVEAGSHTFSVQFAGKQSKTKAEKLSISIEPGKTYYVQLILETKALINNLYCVETAENTAKVLLPMLKETTKCL